VTRATGDPLSELPAWTRWSLQRRLRRAWREEMSERRSTTVALLRSLSGAEVLAVADAGPDRDARAVTDVRLEGWNLRLDRCHWPTVVGLAAQLERGPVALIEARHHGRLWGLYFDTAAQRIPLLTRDVRVRADQGPGRGLSLAIPAPIAPALV